jgi:hypothetical protein
MIGRTLGGRGEKRKGGDGGGARFDRLPARPYNSGRPRIRAGRTILKPRTLLYATLLAGVAAAALAGPPEMSLPAGASVPASPPPLPGGPAPDLVIAFTAQVVGYIEPCG